MFGWLKRNEGFEWREYVRTTVRVRRERRREIIDNAKVAAVVGAREAGRKSASAASGAARYFGETLVVLFFSLIHTVKQIALWTGSGIARAAVAMVELAWRFARRVVDVLAPIVSWTASRLASAIRMVLSPVVGFASRPDIRLALTLIVMVSAFSALHRTWSRGADGQAIAAGLVALLACALAFGPRLVAARAWHPRRGPSEYLERAGDALVLLPGLDRLTPKSAGIAALVLVAVAGLGIWLALYASPTLLARAWTPSATRSEKLEGRAAALAGDRLRLAGTTIMLEGIEAPAKNQRCDGPRGKWRCGKAAKNALARALGSQHITCEITEGRGVDGKVARCSANGNDIAAGLVRNGHVFAATGFFSPYMNEESAAKAARVGLWASVDAKSPRPGGRPRAE